MSVRIRLRRMGKKKHPSYRLAVVDRRVKRDGRYIEFVGYYDPMTEPHTVDLNEERIIAWLKEGASYSDTVGSLLRQAGLLKRWHELRTSEAAGEKKAAKPGKKQDKAKVGAAEKSAADQKAEEPADEVKEESKAEESA
jgi:small subunit ribosomal protein S16